MALDHDLQIASGTIGTISVKDPQGTKVAIWDQVSFDEGNFLLYSKFKKYISTESQTWFYKVKEVNYNWSSDFCWTFL